MTPVEASRPKAEPPERTRALRELVLDKGESRPVSREAGPPPLMSMPPVLERSNRTTVTPVMACWFWALPKRMPWMSVMEIWFIGTTPLISMFF